MKIRGAAVLVYLLLNLLVLSSLLVVTPTTALGCEDEPPQTLLQLYKGANAIYIATYSKRDKGSLVTAEGGEYRFHPIKQHFDISQTLKGDVRKMFDLESEEYVYDAADVVGAEGGYEAEHNNEAGEGLLATDVAAEGDTVMLFLMKDQENPEKLILSHYRDSIKKLDPDSVALYEKRVRELNKIFDAKKPSDAKITEWLVRLAEDPATRWEGTSELSQAFMNHEWKSVEAERRINTGEDPMTDEELAYYANSVYATLLTDTQKQRLSDVLLKIESDTTEAGNSASFKKGDLELVELVKRWGNSQTAVFFLDKLRSGAYTPEENFQMMSSAASILADEQLQVLSSEYMDVAWGADDEPIEAAITEPVDTAVESESPAEPRTPVDQEPEAKRPVTYKERRGSIIASFSRRAAVVMSGAEQTAASQ